MLARGFFLGEYVSVTGKFSKIPFSGAVFFGGSLTPFLTRLEDYGQSIVGAFTTMWAPTSDKWSYNPYKWTYNWVTGVKSPYFYCRGYSW